MAIREPHITGDTSVEQSQKTLIRTLVTSLGRINVYIPAKIVSEEELKREKEDFYTLIARLLLTDSFDLQRINKG